MGVKTNLLMHLEFQEKRIQDQIERSKDAVGEKVSFFHRVPRVGNKKS